MSITEIANVIQPEVFTPYVIETTMQRSALMTSGILVNNRDFDDRASGPNTLINMPFWEDLDGDPEIIGEGEYFTAQNINANKDVARKLGMGNMWGANGLASALSGADPMAAVGNLVANYWSRKTQGVLIATLTGVFASTTMTDKVLDISGEAGDAALLTGESFVDAGQLMGDAKELLTGVMMHSAVEAYLVKRNLIDYVQESEQSDRIPYFMKKRVVVDDSVPYDTTTKTGSIFLFGAGAIALGNGSHPDIKEVETDRDKSSMAGEDYLINRKIFIMHPRGVKWSESSVAGDFPTLDELKNGDNWERVYEAKKVRLVKHTFKIS